MFARLLVLLCLCGCSDATPTRTIVRFGAAEDLVVPAGSRLRLIGFPDGRRQHLAGDELGDFEFVDGIELPVEADDDDGSRRFTVFAELRTPDDVRLSWARIRTGFVQDERSEVRVEFQLGCPAPSDRTDQNSDYDPNVACGSHDTCGAEATCVTACVDPRPYDSLVAASPAIRCPASDDLGVESLETGWGYTCALGGGEAFCWGQIAFSSSPQWRQPSRPMTPQLRTHFRPGEDEVVDISATIHVACMVFADGSLRCGGNNTPNAEGVQSNGLGVPVSALDEHQRCCTMVPDAPAASAVESFNFWTCIVAREGGDLWCTGYRPGFPERDRIPTFERTERDGVITTGWTDVLGGPYSLIGLREESLEWFDTIGDHFDQTGAPPVTEIADIDAAGDAMCIVTTAGELLCWGRNPAGTRHAAPQPEILGAGWRRIALPDERANDPSHRCGIRDGGTLWCWGDAEDGKLGAEGPSRDFDERVQVGSDDDWVDLAVGLDHSCGIREGGHVYCWGSGGSRALGVDVDGGQTSEPQHVPIPGW